MQQNQQEEFPASFFHSQNTGVLRRPRTESSFSDKKGGQTSILFAARVSLQASCVDPEAQKGLNSRNQIPAPKISRSEGASLADQLHSSCNPPFFSSESRKNLKINLSLALSGRVTK